MTVKLAATHQKIQDWWWRVFDSRIAHNQAIEIRELQADMESFMRERRIKLEKPQ